jgi:hypothetical protein
MNPSTMKRVFRLLIRLYPADVREQFGAEMLAVLEASSTEAGGFGHPLRECGGLLRGAIWARCQRLRLPPVAVGLVVAAVTQWLLYTILLRLLPSMPVPTSAIERNNQLTLGLMAVAVLLVIIPLTVVLTRGIQRPARKHRLR